MEKAKIVKRIDKYGAACMRYAMRGSLENEEAQKVVREYQLTYDELRQAVLGGDSPLPRHEEAFLTLIKDVQKAIGASTREEASTEIAQAIYNALRIWI